MPSPPAPVAPDYGGACLSEVMPALMDRSTVPAPPWMPAPAVGADQVVLLVLDGLGWDQLQARGALAPTMASMEGGPITTVAPTTTATALTSLTTGTPPAVHGLVGYRIRVEGDEILNVVRWTTAAGDARGRVTPEALQPVEPFGGAKPPVVTRAEFAESGFTRAHLVGSELYGWRYPSTLVAQAARLAAEGQELIYAYYPGIDTVAHEFGFGPVYDAELAAADRLVADLLAALPAGVAVLVVADHGQVEVGDRVLPIDPDVMDLTAQLSGEGRFRWLYARPGCADRLLERARERHGGQAWVHSRAEVIAQGWLGGDPAPEVASRLGDVAVAAYEPVAFLDPADTGNYPLRCRHGSLTRAETLVPLLGARA